MSFFDTLGKKITDTTHTVVEKTKSSTDTMRLNGQINDEERTINAAYLNIGKKYLELHKDDAEPEFLEYLQIIANSEVKIAEYQEQIRKNKHLMLCASCGAEIAETVLFCTKCGAENPVGKRLAEERAAREAAERAAREAAAAQQMAAAQQAAQAMPQPPTMTQPTAGVECCTACGKPRTPGAMFCTGCGNRFVPVQTAPVPAPAAPVVEAAPSAIPTPVAETPIPVPVVEAAPSVIPTPVAAPVSTVDSVATEPLAAPASEAGEKVCANCGKMIPAGNRFCTCCGTKVEA